MLAGKLVTNELSAGTDGSLTLPARSISLPDYLASAASDACLLSAEKVISGPVDGVYECELAPITFFKLRITPLFSMQIDREAGSDEIAVRVLKGQCKVGDKLSRTITIDALNMVKWSPADDGAAWQLDTSISLSLKVKQAPMNAFALKAWNAAGTAIVKGACKENGKKLLANIEKGYLAN